MAMSGSYKDVQVKHPTLKTFVINPLVHICDKEKVEQELAAKITILIIDEKLSQGTKLWNFTKSS